MRLAVTFLGLDLFSVEIALATRARRTDSTSPEPEDDYSRDLSGGNLGSDRIAAGGDLFLGFTNGRECSDD